jgi:hypothetical protein
MPNAAYHAFLRTMEWQIIRRAARMLEHARKGKKTKRERRILRGLPAIKPARVRKHKPKAEPFTQDLTTRRRPLGP